MKRKGGAALLLGALLLLGACGGDSLETAAPESEAAERAPVHTAAEPETQLPESAAPSPEPAMEGEAVDASGLQRRLTDSIWRSYEQGQTWSAVAWDFDAYGNAGISYISLDTGEVMSTISAPYTVDEAAGTVTVLERTYTWQEAEACLFAEGSYYDSAVDTTYTYADKIFAYSAAPGLEDMRAGAQAYQDWLDAYLGEGTGDTEALEARIAEIRAWFQAAENAGDYTDFPLSTHGEARFVAGELVRLHWFPTYDPEADTYAPGSYDCYGYFHDGALYFIYTVDVQDGAENRLYFDADGTLVRWIDSGGAYHEGSGIDMEDPVLADILSVAELLKTNAAVAAGNYAGS